MDFEAVLHSAQSGNPDAFDQLFEHFGPAVLASLRGKIGAKWQSMLSEEDILIETFSDVYRGISGFRQGSEQEFENWIKKLARNNLLDALRSLNSKSRNPQDRKVVGMGQLDSHSMLFGDITAGQASPSRQLKIEDLKNFIDRALTQISDGYAEVIRMRYFEMKSTEEICDELELRPGAVYMRESKAKTLLLPIFQSFSRHF